MRTIFFLVLFCLNTALFAEVRAEIEPDQINLGDSFQLTITIEKVTTHQTPDLLPLQRDFEINATEHRVSTTIVNGQMETLNQWAILLTPKRAGTLTIPPIRVGQEESASLTIGVSAQGRVSNSQQKQTKPIHFSHEKRLQIKTETTPKTPYVNQEVLLTIKLIHQDQLLDAHYQPPSLEDGLMLPLGDSEQYQLVEKNQIFTVEEQRYALFPQKPGAQIMKGAQFEALVYRGLPERMRARGKPALLHVKKIPPNIQATQWLPAKALSMTEEYSDDQGQFDVGTTLIRTIKIEARALPAELLPTLKADPQDHFGVYPEKPTLKNSIHKQDVAGIKTIRITYLLNQPGEIKLPAYKLIWFNTKTEKEETIELPEKTLTIIGAEKTPSSSSSLPIIDATSHLPPSPVITKNRIIWVVASIIAALMLLVIIMILKRKKLSIKARRKPLHHLEKACKKNDPIQAREALLAFARAKFKGSILNLEDIKQQTDDMRLIEELDKLSAALYAKQSESIWTGFDLWHAIQHQQKKQKKSIKKNTLPKINPDGHLPNSS